MSLRNESLAGWVSRGKDSRRQAARPHRPAVMRLLWGS
jgi:hypothetical protein